MIFCLLLNLSESPSPTHGYKYITALLIHMGTIFINTISGELLRNTAGGTFACNI